MRARNQGGRNLGKEGALSDMDHFASSELMRAMDSMMPVAKSGGRTQGKVTKVEPDGTVWVALRDSRGTVEMPCRRSVVAAKPGDTVAVTVRERRAIVESNISSPAATVEQTENIVKTSAQELADNTNQLFQSAISDAQAAHEAAGRAEKDAQSAADSAASAATSAESAATSAENAERDAERSAVAAELSERKALESNGYALGALNSLATLQNVMGTIGWAADNAAFVEASGEYDPNGRYFVKGGYWLPKTLTQEQYEDGTWYVKGEDGTYSEATGDYDADAAYYTWVAGTFTDAQDPPNLYAVVPESSKADFDAGSYYVMDMRQSMAEYVSKHVVFAYGTLWITPDGVTGEGIAGEGDDPAGRIAIGTEGITLYDGHGRRIARYGSGVDLGAAGDGTQTSIASDVLALLREAVIDGEPGTYPVFQVGTEAGENPFLQFADGKGHDRFTVDENGTGWFYDVPGTRANLLVPSIAQDSEGYWGIGYPDGTSDGFLRVTKNGLIPRVQGDAENSYLGTPGWPFRVAHVKNYFGTWSGNPVDVAHGGTKSTTPRDAAANLLVPSLVGSKYLGENTDLNTVVKFGTYYCTGSAIVKTWKNCPTTYALRMTVANGIGQNYDASTLTCQYLVQEIVDLYANVYRRSSSTSGSTWSAWGKVFDTRHVIGVGNGGSGLTASPSMLVNLASSSAASVFQSAPRPGVTGTLPLSHGGLGSTTAAGGRSTLGLTYEGVYQSVQFATIAPGANGGKCTLVRRGTCCSINLNGIVIYGASSSTRTKIGVVPAGYRPAGSFYSWPFLIDSSGNFYCDMDAYSGDVKSWEVFTYPIGG